MKQVITRDPQGRDWTVRRRWLPWKLRWRGPARDFTWEGIDGLDLLGGIGDSVLGILGIILATAFLVFFILPVVAFLLELVIFVAAVAVLMIIRILFRRPWLVDAIGESRDEPVYVWSVVGWGESGRAVDQVAAQLRSGATLPSLANGKLITGNISKVRQGD